MRVDERWLEAYEVGATRRTTGRTISEADIAIHAGQTGDFFPHHMDAVWAAQQPFGGRIAHGTLVMSIAVGMTADAVNPRATSYGYDRVRFVRPVRIGDTITVEAEVVGTRPHGKQPDRYGLLDERVTVVNQEGDTVLVLTHVYLVERRPSAEATA